MTAKRARNAKGWTFDTFASLRGLCGKAVAATASGESM
jgi:hypothetical protein